MTEEVPDAPYRYIYETVNVDGQQVKVYKLGKFGKEKLNEALTLSDLTSIQRQLRALVKLAKADKNLVQRLKELLVSKLENGKGQRRQTLFDEDIQDAFWRENSVALDELLKEGKVVENRGWIKLVKEASR